MTATSYARLWIFAVSLVATSAAAADVMLPLSEGDFRDWALATQAFRDCVNTSSLDGNVVPCRQVLVFLNGFAARVKALQPPVPPPAVPQSSGPAPSKP
jgi:hypothetical protein